MLTINTALSLVSFPTFLGECATFFETEEFDSRNWTNELSPGWTEVLYQAQFDFIAIEYMQTRIWKFHYNGSTGEGRTLSEAIENHKQIYGAW